MKPLPLCAPRLSTTRTAAFVITLCGLLAAARIASHDGYERVDLVADVPNVAPHTDPALVNGWGVAIGPFGLAWVADAGTAQVSIFLPNGGVLPFHLHIPSPDPSGEDAAPTGLVLNPTGSFPISQGGQIHPARVLCATENGTIAGWSPAFGTLNAVTLVDSTGHGAIYKGLARSHSQDGDRLYATDFHNGTVDVFDASFQPIHIPGAFVDPRLSEHYVPFGIQEIEGSIFVTYAFKALPDDEDEESGPGLGLVSEFESDGTFVRRFASHSVLNAPWGLALSPDEFGAFGRTLLVGNFGDGRITAFDRQMGTRVGQLQDGSGSPIEIDGLWGLGFRPGDGEDGHDHEGTSRLYFAAGPDDENHGLFGFVRPDDD